MSTNLESLYNYTTNILKPNIELINQNISNNLQTDNITGSLSNILNVSLEQNKILINTDIITTSSVNIETLNLLYGLTEPVSLSFTNTSNIINNFSNYLIKSINNVKDDLNSNYNNIGSNTSNYNSNVNLEILNRLANLNISNIQNGDINKYIEYNTINYDLTINGNIAILNGLDTSNIAEFASKTFVNEALEIVSSANTVPALSINQNNTQNTVEIYNNGNSKFTINNTGNIGIGATPNNSNSLEIQGDVNCTSGLYSNSLPFSYSNLSNIPLEFTPSVHSHTITDINGLTTILDSKQTIINSLTSNNDTITINSGLNLSTGYTFKEDNVELKLQSSIITTTTSETTNYWNEKTISIVDNGVNKELLTVPNSTDKYYAFTSTSGANSITFTSDTICDILIVAGGGGGGFDMGGGGGGGGVISISQNVSPGTYNIIVGKGGDGAPAAGTNGQPTGHQYSVNAKKGGNSSFGTIEAIGGGYGGSSVWTHTLGGQGGNGGSGGGSSGYDAANNINKAGTGIIGQGFRGGYGGQSHYSGGGGGAGEVGGGPSTAAGGAKGGDGKISKILGIEYYWGGGGGGAGYSTTGGNGGKGGGGGGAVGVTFGGIGGITYGSPGGGGSTSAWANTPGGNAGMNTGGGGGGGAHYNSNNKGGDGGSGIVIIRIKQQTYPSNITYASTSINANSLVLRNYSSNIIPNGTLSQPLSYDVVNSAFVYEFYPGSNYVSFPYDTTCDLLLVGGGGSGGTSLGTGGNSGNVIYSTDVIVPAGNYNIIVGESGTYGKDGGDTTAFGATSKGGRGIIAKIPSSSVKASVLPELVSGNISYNYYAFTTNGSITFNQNTLCDILIVGGGGSGNMGKGGGSSGGILYSSNVIIQSGTYPIIVGAGGRNGNGGDSTVFGATAKGGLQAIDETGASNNGTNIPGYTIMLWDKDGVALEGGAPFADTTITKYPLVPYIADSSNVTSSSFNAEDNKPYNVFNTAATKWISLASDIDAFGYNTATREYEGPYEINGYKGDWVRIDLKQLIILKEYTLYGVTDNSANIKRSPGDFKVFGSKDNVTHFELDEQVDLTWSGTTGKTFAISSNNEPYRYYTIVFNKISQVYNPAVYYRQVMISGWELYGYPIIPSGGGGVGSIGYSPTASTYTPNGGEGFHVSIKTPNELFAGGGGANGGGRIPLENTIGYGGNSTISPINFLCDSSQTNGITTTINTVVTSSFAKSTDNISTSTEFFANSDLVGRCTTKLTNGVYGCLWEGGGTGDGAYLGLREDTVQGTILRLRAGDGGTAYTYTEGLTHTKTRMALLDIPYTGGFDKYDDGETHEIVWEIRIGKDTSYSGRVRIWIDGELMGTATTSGIDKRMGSGTNSAIWAGPNTGGFGKMSGSVCEGENTAPWPLLDDLSQMDYYRNRLVSEDQLAKMDDSAVSGGSGIVIIRVPADDVLYEENGGIYRLNDNNIIENNAVILNKFDTARENLIAWYKFDSDFTDSSGNGYDAVNNGSATFDATFFKTGNSSVKIIPDSYLTVTSSTLTNVWSPASSFSWSCWIKISQYGIHQVIINCRDGAPFTQGWCLVIPSNTTLVYCETFRTTGGSIMSGNFALDMSGSGWNHCVMTLQYDSASIQTYKFYLNNELKFTSTSGDVYTPFVSSILTIGKESEGTQYKCQNTYIDDFRIYNKSLSKEEVEYIYSTTNTKADLLPYATSPAILYNNLSLWYKFSGKLGNIDSSIYSLNATATGTPVISDGIIKITKDNYLKVPDNVIDFNNDITICFWYRFDNGVITNARLIDLSAIFIKSGFDNGILIYRNGLTTSLSFNIDTSSTTTIDFGHTTSGQMIHLTWVIKKNGIWNIYKNGVPFSPLQSVYPITNIYTYSYFGKSNWSSAEFSSDNQVSLKDFRIYNRSLTEDEIYNIYNQVTTTSLVAYSPTSFISNNNLYEGYNLAKFYNDTTDMYVWYKFNGDLTDSSENGNIPTVASGTIVYEYINGKQSIKFTNQKLWIPIENISLWDSFVFSFWLYSSVAGDNNERIFEYSNDYGSGNAGSIFTLLKFPDLSFKILMNYPGPSNEYIYSNAYVLNKWIHMTLCLNKSPVYWKLYINGVLQEPSSIVGNGGSVWIDDITDFKLSIGNANVLSRQLNGNIDDVRIYNRALTPSEIDIIYNQYIIDEHLESFYNNTTDMLAWYKFDGDFTDSSGNGKDLTYGSDAVSLSTDYVTGTNSAYLNGTQTNTSILRNDTIDLTGLNREFTIAYWIKREENNVWYMVSAGTGTSENSSIYIGYTGVKSVSSDNKLFFGTLSSTTQVESDTTYTEDIGKWEHLAFVRYANKSIIYKNGKIIKTTIGSGLNINNTVFGIGRHISNTEGFTYGKGNYDDVRIYNRALTPSEVALLANRFGGGGGSVATPGTFTTSGGIGGDALIIPMRYNESFAKGGDGFTYNTLSTTQGIGYGGTGSTSLIYNPGGRGAVIIRIPYQPYIVDADKYNQEPTQIPGTNDFYYAFTSTTGTNSITFRQNTLCDVLVVGGGGGGGKNIGGGGGAGAVVYIQSCTLNGQYTISIGDGGATDTKGTQSSLGSIIAEGGGNGGQYNANTAGSGGSSGGMGGVQSSTYTSPAVGSGSSLNGFTGVIYQNIGGKATSTRQGNNGLGASGGGGAGSASIDNIGSCISAADVAGVGGDGIQVNIDGNNYYWGGGGGGAGYDTCTKGGNGGKGGGGGGCKNGIGGTNGINNGNNGGTTQATVGGAGGANTGGGGGGGGFIGFAGGNGGSGIVIIRWTIPGAYTTDEKTNGGVYVDKGGISTVSGDITTYGGNIITNNFTINNDIVLNTLGYTDKQWKIYGNNDNQFDLSFDRSNDTGNMWLTQAKMRGNGGTKGYVNFTGMHHCKASTPELYDDKYIGYIVSSTKQYQSMNSIYDSSNIQRNIDKNAWDALPIVALSTEKDKKVFGIIAKIEDDYSQSREEVSGNIVNYFEKKSYDRRLHIAGVGEGGIWVSNYNGVIESGDYITTSPIPGIGMKQDDDLVRSYTVGKATMDCDFNPKKIPVKILTKIGEDYDKNADGNYTYSDLLDDNGEVIYEDEYEIKYITLDGTIIDAIYTSDVTNVYKIAFIGCSYTCS